MAEDSYKSHVAYSMHSLVQVAMDYIPLEIRRKHNLTQLKSMIDPQNLDDNTALEAIMNSDRRLRWYKTVEQFRKSLIYYSIFTSCHKKCAIPFFDIFTTTPPLMKSLKGEAFLYKHDIFSYLRSYLSAMWPRDDHFLFKLL